MRWSLRSLPTQTILWLYGLEIILLRSVGPQIGHLLSLLQLPAARPAKRTGFQLDQLTDLAVVLWAAELIAGSRTSQLEAEGRAGSSLSAAADLDQLKPNHEIISYSWIEVLTARTSSQKAEITFPKYARWLRISSSIIFLSSWSHQTPKSFGPLHLRGADELHWVQLELRAQRLSPGNCSWRSICLPLTSQCGMFRGTLIFSCKPFYKVVTCRQNNIVLVFILFLRERGRLDSTRSLQSPLRLRFPCRKSSVATPAWPLSLPLLCTPHCPILPLLLCQLPWRLN